MIPVKERTVSANLYLELMKTRPENIQTAEFIPPKLGQKGYGKFKVRLKISQLAGSQFANFIGYYDI